jgi:hypothetical protein
MVFLKILNIFLLEINFLFLDHFDMLILKINLRKIKKIILMHFQTKNTLKNNCYHNVKQALSTSFINV